MARNKKIRGFLPFIIARVIAITLLFLALGQLPYGFYKILRFVVCGVGAYGAYFSKNLEKIGWAWTFGIIAVLFNPLIPVHLDRPTWAIIDVIVAVVIIVSLFLLRKPTNLSGKEDNAILVLFLLAGIFLAGFAFLVDFIGIPIRTTDEDINTDFYGSLFVLANMVLAWRVVYFIFFRKTDGDWTRKQKAMWRYWFGGTLVMGFLVMTIEHFKMPELLEELLEYSIGLGVPFYLYIKYMTKYKNE